MQPGARRHVGNCLPRRPPKIRFAPLALVLGKTTRKRDGDETDRDSGERNSSGAEIAHRIWRALENHRGPERECAEHAQRRSEEHTSELQSRFDLVCRLLLEKKKKKK